jgi:hypothetical protein
MDQVGGVYVPFWAFDGFVELRVWQINTHRTTLSTWGGRETLPGKQVVMVNDLIYPATKTPAPAMLERLFPYQMEALVPYKPRLLADWPAALYARDIEALLGKAHEEMIRRGQRELVMPATGSSADEETEYRRSVNVSSTSYQLVLLPVWAASLRSGDRNRVALVNGQTGKVAIERWFLDGGEVLR